MGVLPLCGVGEDTYGRWVRTEDYHKSTQIQKEVADRFILGGPGEALNFTKIWIPNNCSTHRFTNHTLHKVVDRMIRTHRIAPPFRLIVLGDSATRGLICGLSRLIAGSEMFGPCENQICGSEGHLSMSHKDTHKLANVMFSPTMELSFMYIRSFTDRYTNWMVEGSINKKPYAVLVNTGAWDFDHIARQHMGETAAEQCDSPEMEAASQRRVLPSIKQAMWENGQLAQQLGVRAIYRTNHHNNRFGTHCADDKFLAMLQDGPGSGWEIWDNTRISQEVWVNQTYDGFHFDRHRIHTWVHHHQHLAWAIDMQYEVPGMLEMTLTQSMLHLLFRDVLQEIVDERVTHGF